MIKIYHNPRCKKSREGLEYLKKKVSEVTIIDYLKCGLKKEDLKEILLKSNLPVESLIRNKEEYFKKELKNRKFNEDEWIKIIIENPKLLKRPVVVTKTKAALGQPVENINKII